MATLLDALRARSIPFRQMMGETDEIWLCCPFCQERGETADRRFRLGVNLRTSLGHCFNCEWKSRDAADSLRRKLELGELDVVHRAAPPSEPRVQEATELPEDTYSLAECWNVRFYWTRKAREYAEKRGLTYEDARAYNVGVTFGGKYAYRLIFPVYRGTVLKGFVGRDFTGRQQPKYLNSVGEKFLFNLRDMPPNSVGQLPGCCILTEGIFDCLALQRCFHGRKYDDVVALLGHTLTAQSRAELLSRYHTFVLWPDPDKAGVKGFLQLAEELSVLPGVRAVEFVPALLEKDVDEYPCFQLQAVFAKRRRWSLGVGLRERARILFRE